MTDKWRAELAVAGVLAAFSLYVMILAAELPIGWVAGEGPGGGAFPFWLGALLLACSLGVLARTLLAGRPETPPKRPLVDPRAWRPLALTTLLVAAMIGLTHVIGMFAAVALFLLAYLRFVGQQSWLLTVPIVVLTPIFMFFFFEIALKIFLPKGITEPLFYPLYRIFL